MNNYIKITLGIITVILLFLIIRSVITGPTPYSYVDYEPRNELKNYSNIEYVDTLSHIGLEYLDIENVNITLLDIQPLLMNNILPGYSVDGFVIQQDSTSWQIWLNPTMNRNTMIEILAHELIHINQNISGRLKVFDSKLAMFEGDTFNLQEVSYEDRPWEIEAYRKQREVERYIRSRVFN